MKDYIKVVNVSDIEILAELANELWAKHSLQDLITKFTELLKNNDTHIVIKYINNNPMVFAQCKLRYDYIQGTDTSPVGYLEGVFIKQEYRNNGYASELLAECEICSKNKGCTEFASDCELDNLQVSLPFRAMYKREFSRYFSSTIYALHSTIGMVSLLVPTLLLLFIDSARSVFCKTKSALRWFEL